MPRLDVKSDGRKGDGGTLMSYLVREVRKTISANSAVATSTISEPIIGKTMKASPF